MVIVVHNKNPLFQWKFQKKLYISIGIPNLGVLYKNDSTGLPESVSDKTVQFWLHPKTSDYLRHRKPALHAVLTYVESLHVFVFELCWLNS